MNTLQSEYNLAFEHLMAGNFSMMDTVLINIETNYDLTEEQQLSYDDYLVFFDLLEDLRSQDKYIDEATQDQINILLSLAAYYNTYPGIYARNALIAIKEINYNEPYILPDPNKSAIADEFPGKSPENKTYLKVYPNPANDYINVEYAIYGVDKTDRKKVILLLINDAGGKLIMKKELKSVKDKLVIPTGNMNTGIYFCNLIYNGRSEKTAKFTIIN